MEKKIKGSWVIYNSNKIQSCVNQGDYEKTSVSGKIGILLSAICADQEMIITKDRINALCKVSNINTLSELPFFLERLSEHKLIEKQKNGDIHVLGITTSKILEHVSDIYETLNPSSIENAAIFLSETASIKPTTEKEIREEVSDTFRLTKEDFNSLIFDSTQIGFVDEEKVDDETKILFNGNLFKRETTQKFMRVLDSLNFDEKNKITELSEKIKNLACISKEEAIKILGKTLFEKVMSIGMFDISIVSNQTEEAGFLTSPTAFSKFSDGNPIIDDAFDLAKAFVSSITYGITKSHHARGRIRMVEKLLENLVNGSPVGPVEAIAQDYKILEMKGVVQVFNGEKKGRKGPMLKLLKIEVGELALQAIRQGDISEHSLLTLPTATITKFIPPEINRYELRKKLLKNNPKVTNEILYNLRTGALK